MPRALIIDDEELGRQSLANMLARYCPEVEVVAGVASAAEAREAIMRWAPELLFLDVEMPVESGFDLLGSIHPSHRTFSVIFVTAYDHHALRALRSSALDFLVKPVDIDQLRSAVDRASEQRGRRNDAVEEGSHLRLDALLDDLAATGRPRRIAIPTGKGFRLVAVDDIIRFQADNYYCTVVLRNGERILVVRSIKEFETDLAGTGFLRVHQSHLVNLDHVSEYLRQPERDSGGCLAMDNGDTVDVARRRKDELLARLKGGA